MALVMMLALDVLLVTAAVLAWAWLTKEQPQVSPEEARRRELRELHFQQLAANSRERRRASQGGWMTTTNRRRARRD